MPHDDDLPNFRKLGRFERFILGALGVVGALFAVSTATGMLEAAAHRTELLSRRDALGGQLPDEALSVPRRVSSFAVELAGRTDVPDFAAPSASAVLARPGVYLRVLAPHARSEDEVRRAAPLSSKDAFASCLLRASRPSDEHAGSPCEPGTACAGDATGRLTNLRVLFEAAHPFEAAWAEDAERADRLRLTVLGAELDRVARDLPRTTRLAQEAGYAMVVVDEVPPGFVMPWFETGLEAVTKVPHAARIGVLDLASGDVVLEARVRADDAPVGESGSRAVLRQVQGCGLGLRVAEKLAAR